MAARSSDVSTRVDGNKYRELPEGHRTTFVTAMADMMEALSQYVIEEKRSRLDIMRQYARPLLGSELRQLMDDYMDADASRLQYTAASNFLAALSERCRL